MREVLEVKRRYRWVGKPLKRKEDGRFLAGKGRFISNLEFPGALHAAILRSPYPHARIKSIDPSSAATFPGVRAVFTGRDFAGMMKPWPHLIPIPDYYGIAVDTVRYVGEPVAIIVAGDAATAEDALELVEVEYERLAHVTDLKSAMSDDAPQIHDGFKGNIGWRKEYHYGDVDAAFRNADRRIGERFYFHRYSSTPLEPTSCVARYEAAADEMTIWDQNQQSPMYHTRYAKVLGIPSNRLRIVNPDIGGGFGNKIPVYPYTALIALIARRLETTVRWVADRREDMMALMHSPDRMAEVEAAVKRDGRILGLRLRLVDNFGAYIRHPEPQNVTRAFPSLLGCYRIGAVSVDARAVFTNTCPTGPNRAYGQQHASFTLERLIDIIASVLQIGRDEIRFRNFITPEEMPYETPLGAVYDGGNYPAALHRAISLIDYEAAKEEQQQLRAEGRHMGIGLACVVEGGATNFGFAKLWGLDSKHAAGYASAAESAYIRVLPDGKVIVAMGTVPQGQGHETVAAQIVAEELGVTPDDVAVMPGFDTITHPYSGTGSGTYASRFSQIGVGALVGAAGKIKEKMLRIAAFNLRVDVGRLEMGDGSIDVKGDPNRSIPIHHIARIAHSMLALLPPGLEPGLEATYTYAFPYSGPVGDDMKGNLCSSYANLAGAALAEVDVETGQVDVRRLVIVHDSGTILNTLILAGQVEGGAAHGVGGVLYEHFQYGEGGQLLTSTFADYMAITAVEMPRLTLDHMESPSPFTALGAKGCGEGASMLIPPLISNAVEDALTPLGVRITSLPLTPNKIWAMLQEAERRSTQPPST